MEHRYLVLSATLAMTMGLSAQPVPDSSAFDHDGLAFVIYYVTSPGNGDYSLDGANVLWDFNMASIIAGGTAGFIPASQAGAAAAAFPDANVAFMFDIAGNLTYSFGVLTSDSLSYLSQHVFPSPEVTFDDPRKALVFPFNYQDTFSDTYQPTGGSPVAVLNSYTGYGTMYTPLDTLTDVVKQTASDGSIVFWNTDPLYPIVSIDPGGAVAFLAPTNLSVAENRPQVSLGLMPNPVHDQLRVMGAEDLETWTVLDAAGRVVLSGEIQGNSAQVIDVRSLNAGMYQFVAQGSGAIGREGFMVAR